MLSNEMMQIEGWMRIKEIAQEPCNMNMMEDTGVLCLHCNRVMHGVHDNFLCECGWINDVTSIDQLPIKQTRGILQISYVPIFEDDMETLPINQHDKQMEQIQSLFLDLTQKNIMIESQTSKKMRYHFIAREQLLR